MACLCCVPVGRMSTYAAMPADLGLVSVQYFESHSWMCSVKTNQVQGTPDSKSRLAQHSYLQRLST